MASIGDGFKDIFFAGIGALAITGEKAKDVVDKLVAKGEITVDQGKQINNELTRKATEAVTSVRYDVLEARMKAMTPEERAEFAAKASQIAADINAGEQEDASEPAEDAIDVDPQPETVSEEDGKQE